MRWTFDTNNKSLRDLPNMRVWNVYSGTVMIVGGLNLAQVERICEVHNTELGIQPDSVCKKEFVDAYEVARTQKGLDSK